MRIKEMVYKKKGPRKPHRTRRLTAAWKKLMEEDKLWRKLQEARNNVV